MNYEKNDLDFFCIDFITQNEPKLEIHFEFLKNMVLLKIYFTVHIRGHHATKGNEYLPKVKNHYFHVI